MKTVVKVIGVVGGAIGVLWAMRDRFISVASSREPSSPHFRAVKPKATTPTDVSAIDGIGPVFASRLQGAGLRSVSDLAKASTDNVAEAAGVSTARARSWIEQAQSHS